MIGEECVYGRPSLDPRALEPNQVTRVMHLHLILVRNALLPRYCRTPVLFAARELLGGVFLRNPREFLSFMTTGKVAFSTFDDRNFFYQFLKVDRLDSSNIAKYAQIQKYLTVPTDLLELKPESCVHHDFPLIFRDLRQIDLTDISEESIHILG
jgi:hypothetical protein